MSWIFKISFISQIKSQNIFLVMYSTMILFNESRSKYDMLYIYVTNERAAMVKYIFRCIATRKLGWNKWLVETFRSVI